MEAKPPLDAGPATTPALRVDAIIPALDEAESLPAVIAALAAAVVAPAVGGRVGRIVVVDNGSSDGTAAVARAVVVDEPRRGYGAACLAGIAWLAAQRDPPQAVVFLDGDGADDPGDLPALLEPLAGGAADLVIGSRTLGRADRGALTPQQRAGNAVAVALIGLLYRQRCSDLGPLRALTWSSLRALDMRDRGYGWTVEMQVKALRRGLRVVEVPVRYHRRSAGRSKVSGTWRGTLGAGWKILATIARHAG
jgi:glycosyltransferase involved in cell wall biosynthesis